MHISSALLVVVLAFVATRDANATTTTLGLPTHSSDKRFLRSYDMTDLDKKSDAADEEERAVDLKLLDDLIKPDKIQGALKDPAKQKALFKEWFKDKDMSDAIYAALSRNGQFFKNKDIVIAYGNYMTRKTQNVKLDGWLSTNALAKTKENLASNRREEAKKTFGKWYNIEKTDDDVLAALRAHDTAKKLMWDDSLEKEYANLLFWYKGFVQQQRNEGVNFGDYKYVAP
ncbi:hypothetical protein PHYBOEH_007559 [Phytophthora boehmeriae]|uniref:RxLR effector protein n=1 Tax=Phytophthora boehmeriae TaxID=109152 RepID=A0A8T1WAD6_9STRA|nr:hypothetical protein PHYBOEH_007559 [Phytophthora boehmeriae]